MRYTQNKDVAWRMVDQEAILVEPTTSLVVGLSTTGALLWEFLENPHTVNEMVDLLQQNFSEQPRAQLESDAKIFVDELMRESLIVCP